MAEQNHQLTQSQIDHFLEHGWLKLSNCFSREAAADLQSTLWTRLGMDPDDMSTWHTERINMPYHKAFQISDFSPKTWTAINQLLSPSQVVPEVSSWKDGFIVNLGTPQGHNNPTRPQDLKGWHVDGDFFVHYLDSPEQALLIIPLWSDIVPGGGGTVICPPAISTIAKHLYEHPEGVTPRMATRSTNPNMKTEEQDLTWTNNLAASYPDDAFVEATGQVGDVYLLHPLMLHTASNNHLRKVRVITNPPVSIQEPFVLDRPDGGYSVVERKTLKALDREQGLKGWKITAERQRLVPERMRAQEAMKRAEEERLRKRAEDESLRKGAGVQVKEVREGKATVV